MKKIVHFELSIVYSCNNICTIPSNQTSSEIKNVEADKIL